jgi:hypothetical protein
VLCVREQHRSVRDRAGRRTRTPPGRHPRPGPGHTTGWLSAPPCPPYCWESCNVVKVRADDLGAATRRERVILIATHGCTPDFTGIPLRGRWSCGRLGPPQVHGIRCCRGR